MVHLFLFEKNAYFVEFGSNFDFVVQLHLFVDIFSKN